jgi:hypothetical protein
MPNHHFHGAIVTMNLRQKNCRVKIMRMNPPAKSTHWKMAIVALASLLAMVYIDYIMGYELVFSAAYLIPVSLCAWYFGQRAVWLIAVLPVHLLIWDTSISIS